MNASGTLAGLGLAWVLSCAAGWLTACAEVENSPRFTRHSIGFIHPGTTTRAEIIENLGSPTLELTDPTVIAYAVEPGPGAAPAQDPPMRPDDPDRERRAALKDLREPVPLGPAQWAYCVLLDGQNRVARTGFVRLDEANSFEQALRKWAANPGKPGAFPDPQ